MSIAPKTALQLPRLGKLALAASLALAAGASFAGATVTITSFTLTTDGIPFVAPKFAWASSPTSDITASAQNAGGLYGSSSDAYSADSWDQGPNVVAQTTYAQSQGNVVTFTDALTQLATGGFSLSANAQQAVNVYPTPSLGNTAITTGLQTGGFTLLDGNGAPTSGQLIFDIYYDISVSTTVGTQPSDYSQAALTFAAHDNEGQGSFTDGLLSYTQPGGVGSVTSGHFTIAFTLAAGEVASYSLSGTAFATAGVVPEPPALWLSSIGIFAIGVALRRRRLSER